MFFKKLFPRSFEILYSTIYAPDVVHSAVTVVRGATKLQALKYFYHRHPKAVVTRIERKKFWR
jgi:hypothetical protein